MAAWPASWRWVRGPAASPPVPAGSPRHREYEPGGSQIGSDLSHSLSQPECWYWNRHNLLTNLLYCSCTGTILVRLREGSMRIRIQGGVKPMPIHADMDPNQSRKVEFLPGDQVYLLILVNFHARGSGSRESSPCRSMLIRIQISHEKLNFYQETRFIC